LDGALVDDCSLLDLDLHELRDADVLARTLLLKQRVEVSDLRHLLAGFEVADAGGVEDQVLDVLVFVEDRTDPLCR